LPVPRVNSAPHAVHVCRTVPGTIFALRRENRGDEWGLSVCANIESATATIARSGYPEATSTDSACPFEALGLFISDTVARLDRNG
jgi:hypothetical protein